MNNTAVDPVVNIEKHPAKDLFGVQIKEKGDVTIKVFSGLPEVPTSIPEYVFRHDLLRTSLLWLSGSAGRNLFLSGPSGSGKTSVIEQVCARTGRPAIRVGCHRDLEMVDLIGRWIVTGKDKWEFHYGPLPTAMKMGYVLILDEADTLLPATAMGLNSVLDGAHLYIPETRETIVPTEMFRVGATGNTNGQGDPSGNFRGTTKQNLAWVDRWLMQSVAYLEPEEEVNLLDKLVPGVPRAFKETAVRYANLVRAPFLDEDHSGIRPSVTLTTRGLVRWMQAFEMLRNLGSQDPLREGLNLSLINKGTPADKVLFEEAFTGAGIGVDRHEPGETPF